MEGDVRKRSSKFLFVDEEEGELSDSDVENNEKEIKKKRDSDFINEWAAKVQKQKEESAEVVEEPKSEMDLVSEDEESAIDVKPIAMTITFRDETFSRKHRGVIETQMVIKFGPEMVDSKENCIFVFPSRASCDITKSVAAPLGALTVQFHDEDFCKEYHDYMLHLCKELFGSSKVTSDSCCIEVVQNDLLDFEVDTSRYGRDSSLYYQKPENGKIPEAKPPNSRNVGTCFNCGGQHSLHQCNRPKNYAVINENREKFKRSRVAMNKRYHAEIDRFGQFLPGTISEELRSALGLKPRELPNYIYQMRKYGYPPGWLLEAKVAHSGVSVYGSEGAVPEDGDEEGEVFEEGEKDKYDIKKLIRYPGFNCPAPEDTIEEADIPIKEKDDIESMTSRLAPNAYKAYQKRKSLNQMKSIESSNTSVDTKISFQVDTKPDPDIASPADRPRTPDADSAQPIKAIMETPKRSTPSIIDLGTPLLPSSSPFSQLPARDKFGINISDVINFENLPNATGTYEKVFGSITKIREFNAQRN